MNNNDTLIYVVGVFLFLISLVFSVTYTLSAKNEFMYKNIESAIAKGIDPLAVRCSYADSSDNVCVVYAATHKTDVDAPKIPQKSAK